MQNKEEISNKEKLEQEVLERKVKKEVKKELLKEKARASVKKFNTEFKKEMNTAVLAAFGFLIALVWKDVITNFINNLSEKSPFHGALVSALLVTIVCVLGIMIFSKILKDRDEEKK
jgi:ATP/ADP translocase